MCGCSTALGGFALEQSTCMRVSRCPWSSLDLPGVRDHLACGLHQACVRHVQHAFIGLVVVPHELIHGCSCLKVLDHERGIGQEQDLSLNLVIPVFQASLGAVRLVTGLSPERLKDVFHSFPGVGPPVC